MKKVFTVEIVAPDGTGGITEALAAALDLPDNYGSADVSDWDVTLSEAAAVVAGGLGEQQKLISIYREQWARLNMLNALREDLEREVRSLHAKQRQLANKIAALGPVAPDGTGGDGLHQQ